MKRDDQLINSASNQEGNLAARTIPRLLHREIRREWAELWTQKIEDKQVAEDVARRNYELLFVEEGTVIKASKDYAPPDLNKIFEQNERILGVQLLTPDPSVGGMRKFARDHLANQPRWRRVPRQVLCTDTDPQQKPSGPPRKGGRGWLHRS